MASTLSDDANDTVIKRRTHVVVNSTERFFMACFDYDVHYESHGAKMYLYTNDQ
jgi:hypothetical protein